jgi:hypothetical protein
MQWQKFWICRQIGRVGLLSKNGNARPIAHHAAACNHEHDSHKCRAASRRNQVWHRHTPLWMHCPAVLACNHSLEGPSADAGSKFLLSLGLNQVRNIGNHGPSFFLGSCICRHVADPFTEPCNAGHRPPPLSQVLSGLPEEAQPPFGLWHSIRTNVEYRCNLCDELDCSGYDE